MEEKAIRFFFYTGTMGEGTVLQEEKYEEIVSISLTHVKETGLDILNFDKTAEKRCPKLFYDEKSGIPDKEKRVVDQIKDSIKKFSKSLAWTDDKPEFSGFPFVDNRKKDDIEKTKDEDLNKLFTFFMQCCFLHFILEMENRTCDFAQSPLYDEVRDKLRESFVYQLLCAKIKYTLRLYGKEGRFSKDDYSFVTRKFADLLTDSRINKIISPYSYYQKNNTNKDYQPWFYDPENELEAILEQNREQEHVDQDPLDDNLILKIRDFLYTKHDVYQAMTSTISRRLFLCAQVLMFISWAAILCSSIFIERANTIIHTLFPVSVLVFCIAMPVVFAKMDTSKKGLKGHGKKPKQLWIFLPLLLLAIIATLYKTCPTLHYIHYIFYGLIFVVILLWIVCSGHYNNPQTTSQTNGVIYALFPRILVAEMAAWLTIGIAEDLVKSMLWVNSHHVKLWTTVVVIAFVAIILLGEAKQHSPYKNLLTNFFKKVLPIINHSVFFAVSFGLATQVCFYDNLIRNSDVMSTTVFNDYFDDANYYEQRLENLNDVIHQYENFWHTSAVQSMSFGGKFKFDQIIENDDYESHHTMKVAQDFKSLPKTNKELHNSIVDCFNTITSELKKENICPVFLTCKVFPPTALVEKFQTCATPIPTMNGPKFLEDPTIPQTNLTLIPISPSFPIDSVRKRNLNLLFMLSSSLQKEISIIRKNLLVFNSYDTLMNWATIGTSEIANTGSDCLNSLTIHAKKKHVCCRNLELPVTNSPKRIFPTLLIFHTLIVLVLAFVTQLIISDKSVTEPL